jgi:hypothetical protein
MKLFDAGLIIIITVVLVAGVVAVGSKYFFGMKDDNLIEEMSESVIKEATGVDVDLSPSSPENINRDRKSKKIGA